MSMPISRRRFNDNPEKAPSKRIEALRIEALRAGYRKVVMGTLISKAIGIECMRERCPHFNQWLARMENLADA